MKSADRRCQPLATHQHSPPLDSPRPLQFAPRPPIFSLRRSLSPLSETAVPFCSHSATFRPIVSTSMSAPIANASKAAAHEATDGAASADALASGSASIHASSVDNGGEHLTLHLDVNGTVTPVDSADDAPSATALVNMFLSKCAYGSVTSDGRWLLHEGEEYHEPKAGSSSYYDFRRRQLGHEFEQKQTYRFAEEGEPGARLQPLVHKLRHYYTYDEEEDESAFEPHKDLLFPSAIRLLQRYPRAKIVLRTFGLDALRIVAAVQRIALLQPEGRLKHKHFVGFKLSRDSAALRRLHSDSFASER